jgi:hypothetical protein
MAMGALFAIAIHFPLSGTKTAEPKAPPEGISAPANFDSARTTANSLNYF